MDLQGNGHGLIRYYSGFFGGFQETHEHFWIALEQTNVRVRRLPNRRQELDRFTKLLRCSQNYYVQKQCKHRYV